jgi:hypothetical protein
MYEIYWIKISIGTILFFRSNIIVVTFFLNQVRRIKPNMN